MFIIDLPANDSVDLFFEMRNIRAATAASWTSARTFAFVFVDDAAFERHS
jgi:hypothetical protein